MDHAMILESSKAAREEGILLKKYESHCGNASRLFGQETATMRAEFKLFKDALRNGSKWQGERGFLVQSLEELDRMKGSVDSEWKVREQQDEVVVDRFLFLQSKFQNYVLDRVDKDLSTSLEGP